MRVSVSTLGLTSLLNHPFLRISLTPQTLLSTEITVIFERDGFDNANIASVVTVGVVLGFPHATTTLRNERRRLVLLLEGGRIMKGIYKGFVSYGSEVLI